MTITTVTSRELNQDIIKVKKVCVVGPVYVTNRGEPTHVMMSFEEYQKYASKLDPMAADLYRYLNFDKLPEFTEPAGKASLPILQ